ncbi:hypothetical protein K402DRAFT_397914 [Aulographum hederae CBS 113979]|uniref:Anaphase-promoting complex subunit 2 n=1 Tax=Aulographum hederae CBS 113979 TaxID=1176131 RepID=A0A6G1GMP4_9PEZI|nr:hypothetical protein K402DRAFT_397914 [Aulographum hederae CBS 113979]
MAAVRNCDRRAFDAIFPPTSITHTIPTPQATPQLGFAVEGQSFGGFSASSQQDAPDSTAAQVQVKRNIAWSNATQYLSLRNEIHELVEPKVKAPPHVEEAFKYLLVGEGKSFDARDGGLVDWYFEEIKGSFERAVEPLLKAKWAKEFLCADAYDRLLANTRFLHVVKQAYLRPLHEYILPIIQSRKGATGSFLDGDWSSGAEGISSKFERELHDLFLLKIPNGRFSQTLSYIICNAAFDIFRMAGRTPYHGPGSDQREVLKRLRSLLHSLQQVGLGDELAQEAFAHAMSQLMEKFIVSHYMEIDWEGGCSVTRKLREWVQNALAPFVMNLLELIQTDPTTWKTLFSSNIQGWQRTAISKLGMARVPNLFDYVVAWDDSLGAILDIKEYITTPAARGHLVSSFVSQLLRRLLHVGSNTIHILRMYISVIRVFTELEPRGVLLDRVSRPMRKYLKGRDDTARIIVCSLLAEVKDAEGNRIESGPDVLVEIAAEMEKPVLSQGRQHWEMDWDDMNWTPDPVDASIDYRKSKHKDVIGLLLSLYDREDFITELKTVLGEHLLKSEDPDYAKEFRLLELFKLRLGEDKLQACQVMLHDVVESQRLNDLIVKAKAMATGEGDLHLNAQILSSFFWPSLREETFGVPKPVHELQTTFEEGFQATKDMRKLRWLPALGRVEVSLEFEDRQLDLECQTWQASVIYAFQDGKDTLTVAQLEVQLQMDEPLVRNACTFWVGKLVLKESAPDTYTVLETLPTSATDANAAADAAAAAEDEAVVSAVRTQEDLLMENMNVYRQFVLGMLTNGGSMPVGNMHMMLKMAMQEGFPFGVEELKALLGRMVEEGILMRQGDVFGIRQ